MTRFYLRTSDETVAGPFTGIELREAALAHLVFPNTGVSGTADGPWMRAADIGLFSDKNVPLPHPPGTPVPEFRLTGIKETFDGPLKLRDLLDLAARNVLPSDASIQPVGRFDWIAVNKVGILDACLRGELSRNPTFVTPPPVSPNHSRQALGQHWNETKTTPPNTERLPPDPTGLSSDGAPPVVSQVQDTDLMGDPEENTDSLASDHREQARKNIRERIAKQSKTKTKTRITYACGLAVPILIGVLLWWIVQSSPQTQVSQTGPSEVIGDWAAIPSVKDGKAFGISFRDDGSCVVFNSDGNCWSGNFQYLGNATGESRLQSLGPVNGKVADMAPNHQRFEVLPSDGYVRLEGGPAHKPPMLGDKPIRECFVRREGDYLWIGYLVDVDLSGGRKSLNAGWAPLWPHDRTTSFGQLDADLRGRVLLSRYGIPDEARPLRPIEVAANSDPDSAEPCSLVRYAEERLTLFSDGAVRRFREP